MQIVVNSRSRYRIGKREKRVRHQPRLKPVRSCLGPVGLAARRMMHRLLAECSADGRASLARLTDTSLRDAGNGLLNRHGYVLNAADQRTKVSRTNSAATAWNGYGIYTYDAAGEVRTARAYDGSGAAVASENFDYGYDAGWNLLKRTNNTAVTPYAINVLNQISNDGGSIWVHDANGNLTFRPNPDHYDGIEVDGDGRLLWVRDGSDHRLMRIG